MALDYTLSFTNKEVTPWCGMVFLKQMLQKMNFREQIQQCTCMPTQESNNSYKPDTILESFITSIWCGANRFLHTEQIRGDRALCKIFDWEKAPGQDVYKRYFRKFTEENNKGTAKYFFSWLFREINFNYFTLDIDSSVILRYGDQEGAEVGYNSKKSGRKSHHSIIAFVNDLKLVANIQLRNGKSAASTGFNEFLDDTLSIFGNKKVGLVRLEHALPILFKRQSPNKRLG
ncbi:transposase [Capnocytophaga haemolytica]|jgi:hypothetical protein|nr:transposase [Capnocytophaga haemolytica]